MTIHDKEAIPSILQKIIKTKRSEIAIAKQTQDLSAIQQAATTLFESQDIPRRGFAKALYSKQDNGHAAIIAEIKKASPSKGVICSNFDPERIAQQYETAGAACLSVLTDEQYFQGHNSYLKAARAATTLPVLRKDFMIDDYQIYESYLLGADCILLIVACLDDEVLAHLHQVACSLGLDVLIEVHTQHELERAMHLPDLSASTGAHNIYGINNRDLHTFSTDLQTSLTLKTLIATHLENKLATIPPSKQHDDIALANPLIVTESGIHSVSDMQLMLDNDIQCFLIGEQFMKADHPGTTLNQLLTAIKG